MEDRLNALEDKLSASEAKVAEQAALLSGQATPAVSAGEAKPIDAFLSTVEVGGHVTGSYIYNASNPSSASYSQSLGQFNLDHNTFKLDAAKLELGRTPGENGDAGFQIDLLFGDNQGILGGTRFNTPGYFSDNFVNVQEAYVSYKYSDVMFKFGKWETLLGAELIDAHLNKNVTHGVLFTYAIPLVHTGLLASGAIGESGLGWAAAVTNGWNNVTDTNDNKGLLAQLSYAGGPVSAYLNSYYGSDGNTGFAGQSTVSSSTKPAFVVDFVGNYTPMDELTFWLNVDWGNQRDVVFASGPNVATIANAQWYGAALGAKYSFTDKASFALRGEWFIDDDGYRITPGQDTDVRTLTGTLGYKLTSNLETKLEVRYDAITTEGPSDDTLFPSGRGGDDNTLFGLLNVSYVFD